jgi:hypothetical protein
MARPPGKRSDPSYTQIFAFVPKSMAVKFRTLCAAKEIQQSEVIEEILSKWITEQEQNK